MKRSTLFLATLVTMVALSGSAGPTAGQDLPPGPTTVHRLAFAVTEQPATFETIQMVLDFAPGSWTPPHTHGGETLVTVSTTCGLLLDLWRRRSAPSGFTSQLGEAIARKDRS